MPRDAKLRLCIHGHFYQPPREDPFTGEYRQEPSAAPYHDWNERITAECYTPIAEAGCFDQISFNLGGTLARWMAAHAPATYERIVASVAGYRSRYGEGNGLAQSVHHTILPLREVVTSAVRFVGGSPVSSIDLATGLLACGSPRWPLTTKRWRCCPRPGYAL